MNPVLYVVPIFVLGSLAAAQTSGSLETATSVSVFAKSLNGSDLDAVKKGTLIPDSLTLEASTTGAFATTNAGIDDHNPWPGGRHIFVSETGSAFGRGSSAGTSTSEDSAKLVQEAHSFRYHARASKGSKATLEVMWMGQAMGSSTVSVAIDVDGDSKADFEADEDDMMVRRDLEVVAGDNGFQIVITTNGTTSTSTMGHNTYMGRLVLMFDEHGGHCDLTAYGNSCGPVFSGKVDSHASSHSMDLQVTHAAPRAYGLLMLGDTQLDLRFPGMNCWLYTNPLAFGPFVTDGNGEATMHFEFMGSFMGPGGMQAYLQCAVVTMSHHMDMMTSNGMHLDCHHE